MKRSDFDRIQTALDQAIGQSLDSDALEKVTGALAEGQKSSQCSFSYIVGNRTRAAMGHGSDNAYLIRPVDILVICDEQQIIRQLLCFDPEGSTADYRSIGYSPESNTRLDALTL